MKTMRGAKLPNNKWSWDGDWEILLEPLPEHGEPDKEGWWYSRNFQAPFSSSSSWSSNTRTRIWVRSRTIEDFSFVEKKLALLDRRLMKLEEILLHGGDSTKLLLQNSASHSLLNAETKALTKAISRLGDSLNTSYKIDEAAVLHLKKLIKGREGRCKSCQEKLDHALGGLKSKAKRNQEGERVWGELDQQIKGNQQLMELQNELIKEQDKGLDALLQVIQRQKRLAVEIGDELSLHNRLLEDLDQHVDHTQGKLDKVNKHVGNLLESA